MTHPLYQIDAFTDRVLKGNPAAVMPLAAWLPDPVMQAVAAENNLAETAFFVLPDDARATDALPLRWFTPTDEVDLCGHATLASAFVVFVHLRPDWRRVAFATRSGVLTVAREHNGTLSMDLPARASEPFDRPDIADALGDVLGVRPQALRSAVNLMAIYQSADEIAALTYRPELETVLKRAGAWGLSVSAPGAPPIDVVSRFFAPAKGIPEDSVTGSAHCLLAPYWTERLGRTAFEAYQASSRGGRVGVRLDGDRVILNGTCTEYFAGRVTAELTATAD